MKRIYISLLVFFISALSLSLTDLQAQNIIESGTCGNSLTWVYTSDSTLTISGKGAMDDYGAPPWNTYKPAITTVILGDSVISIGNNAFYECTSLRSVTLSDSLTIIGGSTFARCSTLTSISLPNSLTYIGAGTFSRCTQLTSIIIPNSVTTIENSAFYLCEKLTSVTIGNSVTTIGNSAFSSCNRLTSVTIPNSVTTIEDYTFSGCTRLTSVTIPNSVIAIRNHAFSYCDLLTSVTIPNSVTTIGDFAFFLCMSLNFIQCENIIPPVISGNTFEDVPDTIPVFVPCNAIDTYQTANHWNVFPNFRGMLDTTFIFDTVCYGKLYTDNGFFIDAGAGVYYRLETTANNNCDSVICLTLAEDSLISITCYSAAICQGDTYSDNIFTDLTQAGNYYDTLQSINGCDSIIRLTLTVNSVYLMSDTAKICADESYFFHGKNYTTAGIYYDSLQTINGCDSIFELTLIINPIYFVSDTVVISEGETYNFNGKSLTETGIYYDTMQTIQGCDSIFELNLMYETSIVEKQLSNVKIYPNPTTGQLTITNYELRDGNVEVFDIMGRNVYLSTRSPVHSSTITIDISHLPTGIYFIKIKTKIGIVTQKVIKY